RLKGEPFSSEAARLYRSCAMSSPWHDKANQMVDQKRQGMGGGRQLGDFGGAPMSFRNRARDVLVSKSAGRPVIVMHEIFGLTPTVVDFARLLVAAGFRIYMPVLFGSSDPTNSQWLRAMPCVAFEFRVLANNDPGPWADWI